MLTKLFKFTLSPNCTMTPVVTTDSGANIRLAVRIGENWAWNRCFLHVLHNGVKAGLNELSDLSESILKASNLVTFLKRSGLQ